MSLYFEQKVAIGAAIVSALLFLGSLAGGAVFIPKTLPGVSPFAGKRHYPGVYWAMMAAYVAIFLLSLVVLFADPLRG